MQPQIQKYLPTLRSRVLPLAFMALQFVVLVGLRFVMSFPVNRDSDDANNFLAAIDMGRGNWNLAGWVMAPDNLYTTDVLGVAVLSRLIGAQPFLMRLWEAFLWALIVFAAIALSRKKSQSRSIEIITVLTLLGLTIPIDRGSLGFVTTVSSHASSIFLGLATFWLAANIHKRSVTARSALPWLLVLTVFLGSLADPIYSVMACLPVVITAFTQLPGDGNRRNLLIIGVLAGLLIAQVFRAIVVYSGGFETLPLTISFATVSDILEHFQFALHSIAKLFGADFSERPLKDAYLYLLRFPFFLALLAALCTAGMSFLRSLRTWPAKHNRHDEEFDFLDKTLFASVLLSSSAAIVTTAIVGDTQIRYFLPSAVAGAILVARSYSDLRLFALYTKLAFAASLLVAAQAIYYGPRRSLNAEEPIIALNQKLQAANLHHGYAGYWQGAMVSVLSDGQIQALALVNFAGKVDFYRWFTNLNWYTDAAANWRDTIFFVAKNVPESSPDLSQDIVIKQFGTPDEIIRSGPFFIDVYHQAQNLKLPAPSIVSSETWRSDPDSINAVIPKEAFKVKLKILGQPTLSADRKTLTYQVDIQNEGSVALYGIGRYPVTLGVQLLGSSGLPDDTGGDRNFFRVTLPLIQPKTNASVMVKLPIDTRLKDHQLRFALVQEGVVWHDDPDETVEATPDL